MTGSPRTDGTSAKLLRDLTDLPFLTIRNALEACGWDEEKAYRLLVTQATVDKPRLINPRRS